MFEIIGAKADAQSLTSLDGIGSKSQVFGGVFRRSDSISTEVVGLSYDNMAEVRTGSGTATFGENCLQINSILDWKNLPKR